MKILAKILKLYGKTDKEHFETLFSKVKRYPTKFNIPIEYADDFKIVKVINELNDSKVDNDG